MKKQYVYGEPRDCIICGSNFKPRDKGSLQKCCSHVCRGALQTMTATKSCETCGKQFLPKQPAYKNCSRECGEIWRRARVEIDPLADVRKRMAQFCCGAIARCLRNKTDRTATLLGYSSEKLRLHLESKFEEGMSWENYGKNSQSWSIDHKRPISTYPMTATLAEINALENLQPMWHSQNCSKKNKWEGQ